tara:strand:- start:1789 stop:2562 length:774 start_codon:yes stop_codon:yes gene_type:complete
MKAKIKNFLNKKNKKKIVCLTSYSKSISKILDKYCDLILVGDSLANVLYGMKTTHNLALETIINHGKSVRLGTKKSLLVVDMPKNSYKNPNQALKNAKLILKKTGCDAVKIENNSYNLNIVKALTKSKIDVMGHIGYTPQFKKKFKVEGKNKSEEIKLLNQSKKIEKAGAFSIVLECISRTTAQKISKSLKIPTIGIGSSNLCDGQVLVTDDMLGISGFYPKFVKKYANLEKVINVAVRKFNKDVKLSKFPNKKNSF